MQCPTCQSTDSRVLESRAADSGRSVRRRRECLNCESRFTTYERVETIPITVLKRNSTRETFSRSKLLTGLSRACEKTCIGMTNLERLVDEIESQLLDRSVRDVQISDIGQMVLEELREISEVAYVRFASVYKNFREAKDFEEFVEDLSRFEED